MITLCKEKNMVDILIIQDCYYKEDGSSMSEAIKETIASLNFHNSFLFLFLKNFSSHSLFDLSTTILYT